MKSHNSEQSRQNIVKAQLADLRRTIEVAKILGVKPSKYQCRLLRLFKLKIEWLTRTKLARTTLMKYDRKIKRWTRKLNHETKKY